MRAPARTKAWTPACAAFRSSGSAPIPTQADFDGSPMVTDTMCDEDILNLARVLRERDEGFIEITQATGHIKDDLAFVERLAATAQRPILYNVIAPTRNDPESSSAQPRVARALPREGSADLRPDRHRPHRLRLHARALESLRREPRVARDHDRHQRREDREDEGSGAARGGQARDTTRRTANCEAIQAGVGGAVHTLIVQWVDDQPELEKYVGKSLGQIGAEEEGKHPIDVMLDLSIAGDLKVEFLGPNRGFNAEFMAEMINDSPYTFPGVSDGGAHTKFFTGGAFTTDFLRWLVRDEQKVTLEEAHYRLSALPAHAAGFRDRGVLREGAAADVVVYDLEELGDRARLGRRNRARFSGRRMASRAARRGLSLDHRQRRDDLRRRPLHGRDAGTIAARRPRLKRRAAMELGLWVRSSGRPVTRPDLALNLRFELVARDLQVIFLLHAEPELSRCAKVTRQPERIAAGR